METTAHTPEAQQQTPEADSLSPRQMFDLDRLETLRQEQQVAYDEALRTSLEGGYHQYQAQAVAADAVDRMTLSYIDRGRYDDDSVLTHDQAYGAIRSLAVDRISSDDWYSGPLDEQTGEQSPSGRDRARSLFVDLTHEDYYPAPTDTEASDEQSAEDIQAQAEALAELEVQLNEARDRFSTLAAKRQGSAIRGETKEYKEAEDAYRSKMREYGKLSLKGTIEDENTSDEDKNTAVIGYILDEETKLRNETNTKRDKKPLNKFIKWMNKGNLPVRIAKGVALGLVASITGAMIAGATGGVAVAGAAAAASRFVRGYVMHDDRREMEGLDQAQVKQAVQEDLADTTNDDHDAFVAADNHLRTRFEQDTKIQQNERRKALAWGLGSVAVGTAFGLVLSHGFDVATHGIQGGTAPDHGAGGSNGSGGVQNTPPATTPPSGREILPNMPGTGEAAHHLLDRNASFTITPGEGMYQTFQDMGIPSTDWHDVMIDAGPKLHALGETYWDPTHAEWRISHPGQWSDAAMKIMTDAASRHGYSLAA